MEGLNRVQKEAVECTEGPVLIVAGAGSGKTRVLTCRIANILCKGCDPEHVLSLTFTNKAAKEMKERISLMVGAKLARKLYMGTFHSVFIRLLRIYAAEIGYTPEFTIYDTDDSQRLVKTCLKELQLDDKVYKPKDVLSRISYAKNNLVTAATYRNSPAALENDRKRKMPRISEIYELYSKKCIASGVMDFDDVLLNMNILLRDNAKALKEISEMFKYILVDEYQDTNMAQYVILKKLAQSHQNLCVVGDDSQSIYGFRGARVENILNFRKDYPQARIFRLEQNYRSTQTIVDAANSLIEKNSSRIPKTCFSEGDKGDRIHFIKAYTETEEAMLTVSSLLGRLRSESAQYQDFAILYRTNAQSRALEEALRKRNVPYKIYSGNSFYERAEIKDAMSYLKLTVNINDDESFKRIINKPARGIGDTSLAALVAAAHENGTTLFKTVYASNLETFGLKTAAINRMRSFCDFIAGLSVRAVSEDAYTIADEVLTGSGYRQMLKLDTSLEGQARYANLEELLNAVKIFMEERDSEFAEDMIAEGQIDSADQLKPEDYPLVGLSDFVQNTTLISAADVSDEESANRVALMTVHTSKGLEFPYVYIAGMEENLFPSGGWLASESEVEEERRLFYVAMTRAKKAVTMSYAKTRMRNGKQESNPPSRFLTEIDKQYIQNPITKEETEEDEGTSSGFSNFPNFSNGWRSNNYSSNGDSGRRFRQHDGSGRNYGSGKDGYGRGGNGNYGSSYGRHGSGAAGGGNGARIAGGVDGARREGSGLRQEVRGNSGLPARPAVHTAVRPAGNPVPAAAAKDFIPSAVADLKAGQRIEHNRFGFGVIKQLSGAAPDMKAVISFDNYGEKILLLKYAKVRIAD